MIKSTKALSIRFLKSNKFIAISSIVSIILSVCLIISMFNLSLNARKSLEKEKVQSYGDVDIIVNYNMDSPKHIDNVMINKITSIKDIKKMSQVLINQVNLNSKKINAIGVENDALARGRYKFKSELKKEDVVLSKGLAERLDLKIGNQIKINDKNFNVKEILSNLNSDNSSIELVLFDREVLKEISEDEAEATYLLIKSQDTKLDLAISEKLAQIDKNLNVELTENNSFSLSNIEALNVFMGVLGVLVLVMSGLFIMGGFQTFLHNYRNQFAIIRCIGGSSSQAFNIVFTQCSCINVFGVLLGLMFSYISNSYLAKILNTFFSIKTNNFDFSWSSALIISVISFFVIEILMMIPALKSKKILPLRVISENEKLEYRNKKLNKNTTIVLFLISALIIIYGFIEKKGISYALLGMFFFISAAYLAFPHCIKGILNFILPVLRLCGGNVSYVAIKNLIPQVRKNTVIILSITSMVVIATFGANAANTIKTQNEEYCIEEYVSDIVLTSKNENTTKLSKEFKKIVEPVNGVESICVLSYNSNVVYKNNNKNKYVRYVLGDCEVLEKEGLIPKISGDIKGKVILSKNFAEENNFKLKDKIEVIKGNISEMNSNMNQQPVQKLEVSAIVERIPGNNLDALIDWENKDFIDDYTKLYKVLIFTNEKNEVVKGLKNVKKQYPEITWKTLDEDLDEVHQMFYQRWAIFIVALFIIWLSVVLGVFNSLINNINSKRKEYAILRTLKVNKADLIKVILTQVLVYIFIGVIFGLLLGNLLYVFTILMDSHSKIDIDFKMIFIMIFTFIILALIIFVPFSISLAKRKINLELKEIER